MTFLKNKRLITFIFACLLAVFWTTGCGNNYNHISIEEAVNIMQTETNYLIVDVRTKEEYDKKHIKNAILVPIADIREGKLDLLPDKEQILLIYCRTGRRAEDAASLLASRGYTNVYEFGGIVNWTGDVEGDETNEN